MFRIKSTVGISPVARHCNVCTWSGKYFYIRCSILSNFYPPRTHNFIHFFYCKHWLAPGETSRRTRRDQTGLDETEQMYESIWEKTSNELRIKGHKWADDWQNATITLNLSQTHSATDPNSSHMCAALNCFPAYRWCNDRQPATETSCRPDETEMKP